ncbi:hypothetical protein [Rhodoferax sp.]|uniref:hypothetical protein n=1 Tax=Rhodoferax sp. TaxID=50421 RepID=UPI00374CD36B
MSSPPRMPTWSDADADLRKRYDSFIANALDMCTTNGIAGLYQDGLQLASDLKQEARSLGYSKAYESSNDIYWLDQAAATVAFVLGGPQSTIFRQYLADVLYYRSYGSTRGHVEKFLVYTQCDA